MMVRGGCRKDPCQKTSDVLQTSKELVLFPSCMMHSNPEIIGLNMGELIYLVTLNSRHYQGVQYDSRKITLVPGVPRAECEEEITFL